MGKQCLKRIKDGIGARVYLFDGCGQFRVRQLTSTVTIGRYAEHLPAMVRGLFYLVLDTPTLSLICGLLLSQKKLTNSDMSRIGIASAGVPLVSVDVSL